MALEAYRRKRRFGVTAEPRGGTRVRRRTRKLRFVVQKHRATEYHFSEPGAADGAWWRREWRGIYAPMVSRGS